MAYVTISVIAATYRRAQLHFGNYLESALKRAAPSAPLTHVRSCELTRGRDRRHVRFSVGIMQKFKK